jgi:hypothetical protein
MSIAERDQGRHGDGDGDYNNDDDCGIYHRNT